MAGTLYGTPGSTCTQRVFLVANELGLNLSLSPVVLGKGDQKKESHLLRHPFGKVPAYESPDGFKVFESRAIARYLDAKNGGKLTQVNNVENWTTVENWISVESAYFDKFAAGLVSELYFKKVILGVGADQAEVEKHKASITPVLDVYEKELTKRKFLAGDHYTLADLFHLPFGSLLFENLPELLEGRPHLKKWVETLISLPSWKKTLNNYHLEANLSYFQH